MKKFSALIICTVLSCLIQVNLALAEDNVVDAIKCVNSQDLRVNGIGLLSTLQEVEARYGKPLVIESVDIPERINGKYFFYKSIKILSFDGIWKIEFIDHEAVTQSGLRLSMTRDEIQQITGIKLTKKYRYSGDRTYQIPICWNASEVADLERAIFIKLDENEKLVKFSFQHLMP